MSSYDVGVTMGTMIHTVNFDIMDVIMWGGLFGIFETIINKYVPQDKYNLRIYIYICIFLIALLLQYLFFPQISAISPTNLIKI